MLVEIVVAIGVVMLVLVGISDLTSRTTKMYRLEKEKDEANRLLEARLSQYKNDRDRDSTAFFSGITQKNVWLPCSWTFTTTVTYTCEVMYSDITGQGSKVVVRATWTGSAGVTISHTLSSVFTAI